MLYSPPLSPPPFPDSVKSPFEYLLHAVQVVLHTSPAYFQWLQAESEFGWGEKVFDSLILSDQNCEVVRSKENGVVP